MWCDRIIRREDDAQLDGTDPPNVDHVDLEWNQRGPVLKSAVRGGEEIRIFLPRDERLRHGDVIFETPLRRVVVHIIPCEVIVVRPGDGPNLARLALELGNLHCPTQIDGNVLIFREDPQALVVLTRLSIPWFPETRRFEPTELVAEIHARIATGFQVIRGGLPSMT